MAESNEMGLLAELINAKTNGSSAAEVAALMSSRCGDGWSNNPLYLFMMMMLFGNNWNNRGGGCNTELNGRIDNLEGQIRNGFDNQNMSNMVGSNHDAINNGFAATNHSIGNATTSGVINTKDLQAAIKDCCCQTQQNILKMGYEQQLAGKDQLYQMGERFTGIANGLQKGFADLGYIAERNKCDIINSGNANTQRIVDTLNQHWQADLQQRYNDARLELSQHRQNEYLVGQLKA